MRRVCLTLPTNRPCAATIAAVGAEAAYAAHRFGVEVRLLILDSAAAPAAAEHRAAVQALPPAPGVAVHHMDESEQRTFLRAVIARSGVDEPDRVLGLMLPSGVSYGACTNRAFLIARALGCASVHRRDSDSRYQTLDGEPVFPIHHELAFLGRRAADAAAEVTRSRLDPACADRPVALVGGSFVGEMSVDIEEIHRLDPAVYQEVVGLGIPADCPEIWRRNLIGESFRGAGGTAFAQDGTTLARVNPMRTDMCNIALDHGIYTRVPLPPAVDTIGTDYFLIHLVHGARLPGVLHNRHIVNYYTNERRTGPGFADYQLRFVKFLLSKGHLHAVYAAMEAAGAGLLDAGGRVRASTVAGFVRDSTGLDRAENAARLEAVDRCYRKLGGHYAEFAGALAPRREHLLDEARADMADFALLIDAWEPLMDAARDTAPASLTAPRAAVSGPVSAPDLPRPAGTRIVTLRYAGGTAGRGPVTMGQANMIRCMLRDEPSHINIHAVWPVPEGVRLDAVTDSLRALVVRHEALRTTFPHAPGTAPREQEVAAEGEFTVTVLDHRDLPADPAPYAESVARLARDAPFRLDRDFPLRVTVITRQGAPVYIALASSHAVTDAGALAVLRDEWLTLLAGADLPAVTALTPLDLAAQEAAPTGVQKSQASLRYWERIIRTGPQAMFAEPRATYPDGRLPQLTLRSRTGARALARVAERTGNPPSTVLLTAWCALIAHRAGQDACVTAVPTSNRFPRRLARSVNTVSQDALLALDVRVPSFDALLGKAFGAVLNAYRHSQFDALRLWEMIDRATHERGSQFARDVVFNDVSAFPAAPGSMPAPGGPEPDLELSWGPVQALPTRVMTFAYQTSPQLHLAMWADPALFSREEAEGFLTGLTRLLEAAGEGDVPLASLTGVTGVRPVERGPRWQRVDGCWISPPAVADALSRALGGRAVHVAVEEPPAQPLPAGGPPAGAAERRLTAFIASGDSPLTPARAHAALMEALPGRPGLLAPHRYVIVQDPPAQAGRSSAWLRQRIVSEGSGREPAGAI